MRYLVVALFLGGCASLNATDNALCSGLRTPVDDLSSVLIEEQKNTPDEVIIKGTTVIKGFDSVCN